MCIHVQSITYMHPDKDVLFSNVSFTMLEITISIKNRRNWL